MRVCILLFSLPLLAAEPARFAGPERLAKLKSALPAIEQLFARSHEQMGVPGSAWGVVIDGELVLAKAYGSRNVKSHDPVNLDTAFRIASMTKSFTAAAVLKLRDEGKLSLEDPVEKYLPEFRNYTYPTTDTAPIRVRQLLSHGAGFPEDNPWGDRQLAIPDATLKQWAKDGIPFSTTPDTAYEYSNYGFALAGQIVQKVSGMSYREYVESRILKPLGMTASSLEPGAIPASGRANGYGRNADGFFEMEFVLGRGAENGFRERQLHPHPAAGRHARLALDERAVVGSSVVTVQQGDPRGAELRDLLFGVDPESERVAASGFR